MTRTYSPRGGEVRHDWVVVDAAGLVLGRLASRVAGLLRGKHKAGFVPHLDVGDYVIVVNADRVVLSGKKAGQKRVYRHSGFPGGLRSVLVGEVLAERPERVVEKAVRGMLPKNSLGRVQFGKLRVYAGPDHPHAGQCPRVVDLGRVAQ